ncbi:UNVERIFIED_CONTAM: hypothetical protein HDU68_010046 [Siphonaria sp. JEL0065]|nr:hypothetical protein HDU68_010046 [Siphonaria sp. JEL0065]
MEEIEDGDPWQETELAHSAITEWATDVWAVRELGEWSPVLGHSQLDLSQLEGFDALSSRSHSPEYVHPFDVEYEFDFDDDDDALGWGDVNDDWRRDITDYVAATLGKGVDQERLQGEAEPSNAAATTTTVVEVPKKLRPFRVLVVGAGLGGLLLAQALKKMGLAARVFSQDGDVFGAAWDDADDRLAYRITLSPATLNALRHCLPSANFRALVYHPTTHLPGSPPAVSKIPYVGRYFSAYFHGLIRPSPYTRPGLYTPSYLLPLLPPGLVASPLITHLFGKTKSSNNSSQSLSITIRTLRAILLAGLDVITPTPHRNSKSEIPAFFSTYAQSHSVHDADFGLASVWNHGKAVLRVEKLDKDNAVHSNTGGIDDASVAIVFEDGGKEFGDLVVDLREESGVGRGFDGGDISNLLWISGLYPLNESEKNALIPQSLISNAAIIRSNSQVTLYTSPKHIIHAPAPNPATPIGYTSPSRAPSRRVSYTLAPPARQQYAHHHAPPQSPLTPNSSIPNILSSSPPNPSPNSNDLSYSPPSLSSPSPSENPSLPPRKPARRGSAKTTIHDNPPPPTQDNLVHKKASRDSMIISITTGTNPSSPRHPATTRLRRRTSVLSTRSRTGSTVLRYGSITSTPSVAALAISSSTTVQEPTTHLHWRLCFRVGLLSTKTTAIFLRPGIGVHELSEELVSRRGGEAAIRKIAGELVKGWNEGVERILKGSVGMSVGADAFAGLGGGVVGGLDLDGDEEVGKSGLVVRVRAGPTSLKPFDAPHDTNISTLLTRIRDLSITLERSFILTEIGTAPQIHSKERLVTLLSQYIEQSKAIERKEVQETAVQFVMNLVVNFVYWMNLFMLIAVASAQSIQIQGVTNAFIGNNSTYITVHDDLALLSPKSWSSLPDFYSNLIGSNDSVPSTTRLSLVADPDGLSKSPVLQVTYGTGVGSSTGVTFPAHPPNPQSYTKFTRMSLSYDVWFPKGFNFVREGKLPGLWGQLPTEYLALV